MGRVTFNYRSQALGHYVDITIIYPTDAYSYYDESTDGSTQMMPGLRVRPMYRPGMKFQTVYLLHGGGGNAASWFTCTYDDVAGFKDGDDITGALGTAVNVLDNIFANGDAAPCIIVTPNGDTNGAGFFGFGPVLRDLITKVDETYPTIADRDHRALAGLSMGSIAT